MKIREIATLVYSRSEEAQRGVSVMQCNQRVATEFGLAGRRMRCGPDGFLRFFFSHIQQSQGRPCNPATVALR
jgi:hypothetical protein